MCNPQILHIQNQTLSLKVKPSLQAVASFVNLNSRLECKLGFEFSSNLALTIEPFMVRFNLSAGAHFIYIPAFVEEGNFVDFSNGDDPYAVFFDKIKNLYDFNTENIEPNTLKESINIIELND